ncbi:MULTISPECIES: hypothetical protein [unclassified Streptomyces]|uniref:hypothetical protein n=1 Tax=unclassified Streptomyces TaxID=2593676 RepID=UPI002E8027C4|nr:hypothetical protein [Streptomyces sp. NBC_00589]WTI35620.1 hypothetical protein OIC96_11725 [Streptomyces sp. NBC_00775]WUB30707.1 hypothetical protein OHA51_38005 [Streptomyces sp. NBC_00589]
MERDDLILISVDDHIIEPPDMLVNHLPERYKNPLAPFAHKLEAFHSKARAAVATAAR